MKLKGTLVLVAILIAGAALLGCGGGDQAETAGAQPGSNHSQWMPSLSKQRSVVWAVGDAADGSSTSRAVASMVTSHRIDRLLYLGDVYESGTPADFDRNYRTLYSRVGKITAPTIGNHEWPNIATGYVPYWTSVRRTPPPLYYGFTVSGWQLISLNSNTPESGPQVAWLKHLIQTTPQYGDCRIAFDHHPFFSTGPHGGLDALQAIFGALRGNARIVLSGHDHDMQRFRPIGGIVQLVDGAGGAELYPFASTDKRRVFGNDTDHGALRLVLSSGRANLTFVAQNGRRLDHSVVNCQHE